MHHKRDFKGFEMDTELRGGLSPSPQTVSPYSLSQNFFNNQPQLVDGTVAASELSQMTVEEEIGEDAGLDGESIEEDSDIDGESIREDSSIDGEPIQDDNSIDGEPIQDDHSFDGEDALINNQTIVAPGEMSDETPNPERIKKAFENLPLEDRRLIIHFFEDKMGESFRTLIEEFNLRFTS
ncbi:hypothetical protein PSTG_13361 [Puccinia striiformis f. sp. tritici PST-78]|uniref:Uncharacterized protein n=1 Tax=Puccinia striiformis f. sp. tritici PST-78 TaxID=1165861 RepID=A0A0L0V1U0_9BASI|nr:hypothetical protein PSTG_13361 [Puccinia striiformis f. sp. tritici PST-78]